jgi:hypothetical protein
VTLLQRLRSLITGERSAHRRAEDESEEFVGRVGGDETGDVGLSGSEARSGQAADGTTGAAAEPDGTSRSS